MFINNYTLPRPPQRALDQCHAVIIDNPAFIMGKARRWCHEQSLSLVYTELFDTSNNRDFEEQAFFYFIDAADATFFRLKWL